MKKEPGYDEYLAEKIQRGLADIENGRICSLDEANAKWQNIIDNIACKNAETKTQSAV